MAHVDIDPDDLTNQSFFAEGGPGPLAGAGVVLCHGFSGTPSSMRDWADYLHAQGAAVALPKLPGHAASWQAMNLTTWRDWYWAVERGFDWVAKHSDQVFVAGLSMGGALATRLAEHEDVAGLLLVNPSLGTNEFIYRLVEPGAMILPSVPGVGGDTKNPDAVEPCYDRAPLRAVVELKKLWADVDDYLELVDCPVALFKSEVDHVVDGYSQRKLRHRVRDLTEIALVNSYHVATIDYDAELIFDKSTELIKTWRR